MPCNNLPLCLPKAQSIREAEGRTSGGTPGLNSASRQDYSVDRMLLSVGIHVGKPSAVGGRPFKKHALKLSLPALTCP